MRLRPPKELTLLALLAVPLASPGVARAQAGAPDVTTGQALFDAAVEEMNAKRFDSACPKLEEVTRLVPDAVGAKVQLAECYEGWGRLASAWSQWGLVEALASKSGQSDRQTTAARRIAELRPKLAQVTIRVAPAASGLADLAIVRDGSAVGRAQWETAVPVDRGEHVIEASAAGHSPWSRRFIVEADGSATTIDVPALTVLPADAQPPPSSAGERPWQTPLGIAALGAGGAAIGVGAIFGVLALGTNADSNDGPCDEGSNRCDASGLALRDSALGQATVSTVLVVAGSAVAAGGLVLVLTAPDDEAQPTTALRVAPSFISAEGTF